MKVISKSSAMTVHRTLILVIGYYLTTAGVAEVTDDDEDLEAECPPIVSRNEWGALPAKGVLHAEFPVKRIWLQHTVTQECSTAEECVEIVRYFQELFLTDERFIDIPYSFLIGGDGRIYEGLGWRKKGLITFKPNISSMKIGFIGKFDNVIPNDAMTNALRSLLRCAEETGELVPKYELSGNRLLVYLVKEESKCWLVCLNSTFSTQKVIVSRV